jgi:hypothetical protein
MTRAAVVVFVVVALLLLSVNASQGKRRKNAVLVDLKITISFY